MDFRRATRIDDFAGVLEVVMQRHAEDTMSSEVSQGGMQWAELMVRPFMLAWLHV